MKLAKLLINGHPGLRKGGIRFRLSVLAKLVLGFAAILLVAGGASLFHLLQFGNMKQQIEFQNRETDKQLLAMQLKLKANELDGIKSAMIVSRNPELSANYNEGKTIFYQLVEQTAATAGNSDERKWGARLKNTAAEFTAAFDQALAIMNNQALSESEMNRQLIEVYNQSQLFKEYIFELADQFAQAYKEDADAAAASSSRTIDNSARIAVAGMLGVLALCIGIGLILIRAITKPVFRLQSAVQQIAAGDLRHKIDNAADDELGDLSRGFDHMVDQVSGMVGRIRYVAGSLADYSRTLTEFSASTASANRDMVKAMEEIASGAAEQAERSEHSVLVIAALEEQMRSIAQYTETVREKSIEAMDNTAQGSAAMERLSEASSLSGELLGKVCAAMDSLAESSAAIGRIVGTIADISSRTNVLALNASIEAARAGSHGRGFAVIAEQVRHLSSQTVQSSRTISDLIRSLQENIGRLDRELTEARLASEQQSESMHGSMDAFRRIRLSMEELDRQLQGVFAGIADVHAKHGELVDSVQQAAGIAQEIAAGTEEAHASSGAQDEAVRRIAAQADDILALSRQLFAEIDTFRTAAG